MSQLGCPDFWQRQNWDKSVLISDKCWNREGLKTGHFLERPELGRPDFRRWLYVKFRAEIHFDQK